MSASPVPHEANTLWFTAARQVGTTPGFPCDHPYAELVYMPLTGPAAIALLRRLNLFFAHSTESTIQVDAADLASGLGLRARGDGIVGARSTLMRTIQRLVRQKLAAPIERRHYRVLLHVPPLSDADVQRLPLSAQAIHRRYLKAGA